MCNDCLDRGLNRRSLLALTGFGLAATALAGPALASEGKKTEGHEAPAENHAEPEGNHVKLKKQKEAKARAAEEKPVMSPDEALDKLREGNRKFVADANGCAADLVSRREELAAGQHPWAVVLTCSDSRVTPELIFGGVSLGELFVIRNAGNVLDTGALGTIEYGTEHLHAPLVVVMGHKKCGAVSAACDVVSNGTELPASIGKMIQPILPTALNTLFKSDDFVGHTIKNHARKGASRIAEESPIVHHLVGEGRVKIVAAVYDIETGEVEFMEAEET